MTPSQYIESELEAIHKLEGRAGFNTVLMLVKRRIWVERVKIMADCLEAAANKARSLVDYVERMERNNGPKKNTPPPNDQRHQAAQRASAGAQRDGEARNANASQHTGTQGDEDVPDQNRRA